MTPEIMLLIIPAALACHPGC